MAENCVKDTQDPSILFLSLHENLQLSQEEKFNLKIRNCVNNVIMLSKVKLSEFLPLRQLEIL